jgi:hypothetical protein
LREEFKPKRRAIELHQHPPKRDALLHRGAFVGGDHREEQRAHLEFRRLAEGMRAHQRVGGAAQERHDLGPPRGVVGLLRGVEFGARKRQGDFGVLAGDARIAERGTRLPEKLRCARDVAFRAREFAEDEERTRQRPSAGRAFDGGRALGAGSRVLSQRGPCWLVERRNGLVCEAHLGHRSECDAHLGAVGAKSCLRGGEILLREIEVDADARAVAHAAIDRHGADDGAGEIEVLRARQPRLEPLEHLAPQ